MVGLGISAVLILSARSGLPVIPILGFWLAGVLVRARRRAASLAGQNAALERQAACSGSCTTPIRRPASPRSRASASCPR
ncbi:MAG: hypothetical protein ACRDRJ_47670 [Streptosporangiaceae bacterium]